MSVTSLARAAGSAATSVVSPAPRNEWSRLLENSEEALAFQTPAWLDCMQEVSGYQDASRLYRGPNGRSFVVPMARQPVAGGALAMLGSMPFGWGTGGVVAAGSTTVEEARAVFGDLQGRPILRTSLRPNPLVADAWEAAAPARALSSPRTAHVLDLAGGFDEVWTKRFEGTARTAVRKAEKSGLVVESDTTGRLVPAFYELYRMSVDRWAEQQHEPRLLARWRGEQRDPIRKFEVVARRLGENCRVWVAWQDGQAAAAIITLQQGATMSYWRGAMHKELAGPTRANYLLHRHAIELACQAGCRWYHMGETGSSVSLAQFKTRFGAEPYGYAEYYLEPFPLTRSIDQAKGVIKWMLRFKD